MLSKIKRFSFIAIYSLLIQINIFGMIPYTETPKPASSFNISLIFQQLFSIKNPDGLYQELLNQLRFLKQKNKNNELITDIDVEHIKQLWDEFNSLHNHDWLDCIVTPFRKMIDQEKVTQNRNKKPLNQLLHSDGYSPQNRKQMDSLFVHLGDASRPQKPTDSLVCVGVDIVIMQGSPLVIALINKTCPQLLKDKNFEKMLLKEEKKLTDYNKNVALYQNKIKETQERISYKRMAVENLINSYCKNKHTKE